MSKWLKVSLMLLGSAIAMALAIFFFYSDQDYAQNGKVATINPTLEITLEQAEDGHVNRLGHMSYVDAKGRVRQFKRFLNDDLVARFERKEAIQIYYLPDEWNTETFEPAGTTWPIYVLVSVAFLAGLAYVIRQPSSSEDASPTMSMVDAWMFRTNLLVMALACLLIGGGGLFHDGAEKMTGNLAFFAIGLIFSGIFAWSLKMR
jgi:hypothetical protein